MCGICGIVKTDPIKVERGEILRMRDSMSHRGPDDEGILLGEGIALGHRRLSIIDLQKGRQPIFNEDQSIAVVYNGEIYNYRELKIDLQMRGHRFSTNTDAEVIPHLYEEMGDGLVTILKGMFAFALWDHKNKSLFLARDRLGIKPLYFAQHKDSFLFSSEIKAILEEPEFEREIHEEALSDYFRYGTVFGETTLFKNIYQLQPGHQAIVKNGSLSIRKYWDLKIPNPFGDLDGEPCQKLDEFLHKSIKMHMLSDVPIGAFLSGGIDSSTIVYYMSQLNHKKINTFSLGFTDQRYNELNYANIIAHRFETQHYPLILTEEDFLKFLPRMIWHNDEPLPNPAAIPIYCLAKKAKERGVSVLLSGEGADEMFAGYTNYSAYLRDVSLAPLVPHLFVSSLLPFLTFLRLNHLKEVSERYQLTFLEILEMHLSKDGQLIRHLIHGHQKEPFIKSLASSLQSKLDPLSLILYIGFKTSLPSLLMRMDKMSMAASVEARVPFLDHELVEFVWSLPNCLKVKGRNGKLILRQLAKHFLPREIVFRKKMGFPVPTSHWFSRNQTIIGLLKEKRSLERPFLNKEGVLKILSNFQNGDLSYASVVWKLLNLELWTRIFIERERY